MFIERLQVEQEGFLAGLDLEFAPGLNVIIGARGTGKTSLIELIRYCVGAGGFTEDATMRGGQQALAVLQGGAASVTLNGEMGRQLLTRAANGHLTSSLPFAPRCTVLAQNEVEAVGAQSAGRLHLIDRFRPDRVELAADMNRLTLEIQSLTAQVRAILTDGASIADQISSLSTLQEELNAAKNAQQQLLVQAQATDQERETLSGLEAAGKSLTARGAIISESLEDVASLGGDLDRIRSGANGLLSGWTMISEETPDIVSARSHATRVVGLLAEADQGLKEVAKQLNSASAADLQRRQMVDEQSRQLRQTLDAVQTGVSAASRRVQELEERMGQLNALNARLSDRRSKYLEITARRDALYGRLDLLRDQIFQARQSVAENLNESLGPSIRVRVIHAEQIDQYQSAIVAGLRGTGLHYNSLAPLIASGISPFELVTWVEGGNIDELSNTLNLSRDRAGTLVSALRHSGTPEIISSAIEDGVALELLDGRDFKSSDRLSIGQRCTVVLPVLLGQHGDPLLVDQPEDHLDNAFIASTLVSALRRRQPEDQFIFTSHNANIPVLGEANRIIVMDSDGDRGYVAAAGSLDDPAIVEAVTRIMEGGEEAFAVRANFYAENNWGRG